MKDFNNSIKPFEISNLQGNNRTFSQAGALSSFVVDELIHITKRKQLDHELALNIIIPVCGREKHLIASLRSLNESIEALGPEASRLVAITVVEMSEEKTNLSSALEGADYYLFVRSETFNKSYAMNAAATAIQSTTYMFYDVDLVVEKNWIGWVLMNIESLYEVKGNSWVFQPILDRKIFYVDRTVTDLVFSNDVTVGDLRSTAFNGNVFVQPTWHQGKYPPGGCIVIPNPAFAIVGGYDAQIFWGYSPEDVHFLKKLEFIGIKVSCAMTTGLSNVSDEGIRIYHLFHEEKITCNKSYELMVFVSRILTSTPRLLTTFLLSAQVAPPLRWDRPDAVVKIKFEKTYMEQLKLILDLHSSGEPPNVKCPIHLFAVQMAEWYSQNSDGGWEQVIPGVK